jgi:hypothetical protein
MCTAAYFGPLLWGSLNTDSTLSLPLLQCRAIACSEDPHFTLYAAPVVFARNDRDVPVFVRSTDAMWAAMHMQNMNSSFRVGFPVSNYHISLVMAQQMGFW